MQTLPTSPLFSSPPPKSQRLVARDRSLIVMTLVVGTVHDGLASLAGATSFESGASSAMVMRQGIVKGYEGDRRKILVLDDRWENRSVLQNLLAPIGFKVLEADGQECMAQALSSEPDLIITDLIMPVMDGFEFMQKLRSRPQLRHHTVIVSSATVFEAVLKLAETCEIVKLRAFIEQFVTQS